MLLQPAEADSTPFESPILIRVPGTRTAGLPFLVTSTDTHSRPSRPDGSTLAAVVGMLDWDGGGGLGAVVGGALAGGALAAEGSGLDEGRAPTVEHAVRDRPITARARAKRL